MECTISGHNQAEERSMIENLLIGIEAIRDISTHQRKIIKLQGYQITCLKQSADLSTLTRQLLGYANREDLNKIISDNGLKIHANNNRDIYAHPLFNDDENYAFSESTYTPILIIGDTKLYFPKDIVEK